MKLNEHRKYVKAKSVTEYYDAVKDTRVRRFEDVDSFYELWVDDDENILAETVAKKVKKK